MTFTDDATAELVRLQSELIEIAKLCDQHGRVDAPVIDFLRGRLDACAERGASLQRAEEELAQADTELSAIDHVCAEYGFVNDQRELADWLTEQLGELDAMREFNYPAQLEVAKTEAGNYRALYEREKVDLAESQRANAELRAALSRRDND